MNQAISVNTMISLHITMVFHDQSIVIEDAIHRLNQELSYMNLGEICIHTGPIIRKEEVYEYMSIKDRPGIA